MGLALCKRLSTVLGGDIKAASLKQQGSTFTFTIKNYVNSELKNISEIKAPLRLALLPYVSAYGENYQHTNTKTVNGGLDVKYGINESFTLDMTLIPDFGQVASDDKVYNFSPFEIRYNEQRRFLQKEPNSLTKAASFIHEIGRAHV